METRAGAIEGVHTVKRENMGLLPGMFGNAVVWRRARSSVDRALTRHSDAQLRARATAARGGTSRRAAALTVGVLLLTALAGHQAGHRAAPEVAAARAQEQQPAATDTAGRDAPPPTKRGSGTQVADAGAADSTPPARADRGARVQRLMAQMREAAARKDFGQARSHLEAALALDPANPRLQRLRQRALRAH